MSTLSEQQKIKKEVIKIVNLLNTSNFNEAINKTAPLLKKYPKIYIFYNALGLAYNSLNNYAEAKKILNEGIKRFPNNIFILNNLGLVEGNLENFKAAEQYLKRALDLRPLFLDAAITLANLKLKMNEADEAIKILEETLKNENSEKNYVVNFTIGNAYQQKGFFKEAMLYFNKCLEIDPENTAADKAISLMTKYTIDHEHLKKMKLKFEKVKSNENKMFLSFAIGKALEDIKNFKQSFAFLKIGNNINKENLNFDISEEKKLFKNIKNLFSGPDIQKHKSINKKIIFIVGMPRSGTSLVEQILSSHKKVYGAGELNTVRNFIEQEFLDENFNFNIKNINDMKDEQIDKFQNFYILGLERFKIKENIIIDKAPLNFKWIGFILKIFPGCKIIHCERDSMDVCWSNYKNYFSSPKMGYSYDLESLGDFYNSYKDLLNFWNKYFYNKIYNISYEKLVKNQKEEVVKLLNYCDLDWDDDCMTFYKNKKTVATASLAQVRSPIYKSSVSQWKNFSTEIEKLTDILKN